MLVAYWNTDTFSLLTLSWRYRAGQKEVQIQIESSWSRLQEAYCPAWGNVCQWASWAPLLCIWMKQWGIAPYFFSLLCWLLREGKSLEVTAAGSVHNEEIERMVTKQKEKVASVREKSMQANNTAERGALKEELDKSSWSKTLRSRRNRVASKNRRI